MALTAKFTADFSQFEGAIKAASVTVNTFEKGVKSAAADLNRLAASLSGAEIQRQATTAAAAIEAIGGASKLTAAEATKMLGPIDQALDKYKALGQQAPPELEKISKELREVQQQATKTGEATGGIGASIKSSLASVGPAIAAAFSVGAIVSFGRELVELGGKITDTANKLGISTEAVQELEYAATATGTSIDTFSGAMSRMQDKLAEGGKSTQRVLDDLNLSMETLRGLSPDQAFTAMAEAIRGVQDPMKQTQLAMELFGKAGVEMLPAIRQGMGELRQEAHDTNQVIGVEGVKALDDFGDMWSRTYKSLQVTAATAAVTMRDDWSTLPEAGKTALAGVATVFFKPFGDLARKAQIETRELEQAIKALPPIAPPAAFTQDTGARGRASAELEADRKRLDALVETTKAATEAADAYGKEIAQLRDQLSGAALQGEIRKLDTAWKDLTKTQQANVEVIKRIVPQLEAYLAAGGKLTPTLQKVYEEHRKLLPVVTDVSDRFRTQIIVLGNYDRAATEAKNAMEGLRKDGLLPIRDILPRMADAIDTSGIRTNNLAGQFRNAARSAADLKREAEALASFSFGENFGQALFAGFEADRWAGVGRAAGDQLVGEFTKSIQAGIKDGGLDFSATDFALGLGTAGISIIATVWTEMFIEAITQTKQKAEDQARVAGAAIASQFAEGFGGTKAMREFAERAGATNAQIARAMAGTAEQVQEGIAVLTPLINRYTQTLEGLSKAAGGVNVYAKGLADQFAPAVAEQKRALAESHAAILQYEKEAGASTEQLAQLQATLAKDASGQVFTATAENIDRINALGTITAGVIANTVGRTGDLIGAINAVGPSLENLDKMRDQFALTGEQLSPVTQEVLKLYDTVRANEDVFSIISGLGTAMEGFGQAMLYSSDLASAFGGELAAQFTILKDRGVDATVALASMAPQLQELWEMSESGRITVDETTQALLDQAEAQEIVGDSMRDANEQILEVLVEIKDLFAEYLPTAIARTGDAIVATSARGGNAIARTQAQAQQLARDLGPGVQHATNQANAALDTLARRRITIPIDWDVSELPSEMGGAPPDFGGGGVTQVNVNLDGRTIAEVSAPHMGGVVNAYGVS